MIFKTIQTNLSGREQTFFSIEQPLINSRGALIVIMKPLGIAYDDVNETVTGIKEGEFYMAGEQTVNINKTTVEEFIDDLIEASYDLKPEDIELITNLVNQRSNEYATFLKKQLAAEQEND